MNISFSAVDDAYIKEMVETGYYANATELIRDAVRRLREISESKGDYNNAMYAAVLVGEEQYARGQYRRFTPELVAEMDRNIEKKIQQGYKPKPEIIGDEA